MTHSDPPARHWVGLADQLPAGGGASPMAGTAMLVPGKVMHKEGTTTWAESTEFADTDTSFGPVNMLLA